VRYALRRGKGAKKTSIEARPRRGPGSRAPTGPAAPRRPSAEIDIIALTVREILDEEIAKKLAWQLSGRLAEESGTIDMDENTARLITQVCLAIIAVAGTLLGVALAQGHQRTLREEDRRIDRARRLRDRYADWAGKTQVMLQHYSICWGMASTMHGKTDDSEKARLAAFQNKFDESATGARAARAAILLAEENEAWRKRLLLLSNATAEARWDPSFGEFPASVRDSYSICQGLSGKIDELLVDLLRDHPLLKLDSDPSHVAE